VHVVEIVKMHDEELYLPDDVLEEASAASYQNYVVRNNWKNLRVMKKPVSESEVNERETFTHW
jgi:hypothetical protein